MRMKDSGVEWLGQVPEHWEVKRMKDISYMYSGLTGKSGDDFRSDDDDLTKPYIPYTNILNNIQINPNQMNRVVIGDCDVQNVVRNGDILFLMSSEDYESIGKSAVVTRDIGEVYLNSFCRGLRLTNHNGVFAPFVNYQLSSDLFRDQIRLGARGFTRINLKIEKLTCATILLPPLSEQKAIAEYLDRKCGEISRRLELLDRKLECYGALRSSLISRAVTRGLDPEVPLKDSGVEWLGQVPEHWEVKRMKDMVSFSSGENITSQDFVEEGLYPVYGANGRRGFYDRYNFSGTRILIGRVGALCGNVHITNEPIWVSEHALVSTKMKSAKVFEYNWLFYTLQGMKLNRYGGGSAQPVIPQTLVNCLGIPLPPLSEQKAIAEYLDDRCGRIDRIVAKISEQKAQLLSLRGALIDEMVTGQRPIPQNTHDHERN